MSFFQLEGISSSVLHPGEQDREEDLRGAQEVDGNLRGRRKGQVRQAGQRSSHLRGSLLPCQGNSVFN